MANTVKLWLSPETGRLLSSPSSFASAQAPTFYSGNNVDLELHLLYGVGVAAVPYESSFPAGATVSVAIGTVATAPTSGQWRLSVSSTETADLAYNASASAVQTALNALSAVSTAGGVTVAALGGGYSITWNTVGTKPAILAGSDTLAPASYEAILTLQAGDVSTREIVFVELRQSPVALADSFSTIGTPVVTATEVSAWNGTNKVVRVAISPAPKSGSFTTTINGKTAVVDAFSSSSSFLVALQRANVTEAQSVSVSGQNQYDLVLTSNVSVSVNGSGLIASPGLVGTLNLATSELIAYLGSEASKAASLEITITAGGDTQTVVQTPCNVANGVVSTGAVAPVSVGTVLTEAVANNRFVRRDVGQSPSSADLDVIWPNLGVTADGSDVAAALSGAASPSSGNVYLTQSAADALYAPFNWNPFDQELNTNDTVVFDTVQVNTGSSNVNQFTAGGLYTVNSSATSGVIVNQGGVNVFGSAKYIFPDATQQVTAFIPADYLTASAIASTYLTAATASSTYALQSSFNQGVKTTDSVSFSSVSANTLTGAWSSGGASPTSFDSTGITFNDSTTQTTRVVREVQTNGSGIGTSFTTHYPDEVKVIDDTGTAYWVPARLA